MYTKGIKEHNHNDWPSLVRSLEGNQGDGFIYRGQSNSPNTEWKVISSFNRHYSYSKTLYSFETFIDQQLSDYLFNYYDGYSYEKMEGLASSSLCERLYFLQHYGIPTCLLDFTKDPLIGVYFALSGVALSDKFPLPYSDKDYISVYQLNLNVFPDELKRLKLSELEPSNGVELGNYASFLVREYAYFAIDIEPEKTIGNVGNFNLTKQKGAFILFDNLNDSFIGLFDFLSQSNIGENGIVHHKLKYNSIVERMNYNGLEDITLFGYLKQNKNFGKYLFNDIQGLKYDLNFFHH